MMIYKCFELRSYQNKQNKKVTQVVTKAYVINVIVSSMVIIKHYYGGVKTIAGLLTNVLLVSSKLGEDLYIMYQCTTTDMIGLSTSIMEPTSYNVVETTEFNMVRP